MGNIATGSLCISLNKDSELNKIAVDEIINNLQNNKFFSYWDIPCEVTYNEHEGEIEVFFSGKNGGGYCWDWINTQLSHAKNFEKLGYKKELNPEARTLLINSEIFGTSFDEGNSYLDRVTKKKGAKILDIYYHTKLDSEWWEVLEIINAYNLNQGDSQDFGNVEVTLCEKSESEKYLFKIVGGAGGFIVLYDKSSEKPSKPINGSYKEVFAYSPHTSRKIEEDDHPQPVIFLDINKESEELSINEIYEGLESGDLEQDEDAEYFYISGELIYDLIGDIDKFFELEED